MIDHLMVLFVPLVLICLAALVSELAGVLNISIEGLVALGSFIGLLGFGTSFGPVPSFAIAVAAGSAFGVVLGLVHNRLSANIFLSGLGINLIALALVAILGQLAFGSKGAIRITDPALADSFPLQIFIVGAVLVILVFGFSWSLVGIRLRSLAKHADMLYARGVNVRRYKAWALACSGGLACLAGVFMTHNVGAYVPQGVAGKGWIALVLVYVGARRPLGVVVAAAGFVAAEAYSITLQRTLANPGLAVAFPYLLVLLGLVVVQVLSRKKLEF